MKYEKKWVIIFSAVVLALLIIVIATSITPKSKFNSDLTILTTKVEGDYVMGDTNAPVTIIEYSDYQCPACVVFYKNTFSLIEEQYIKTGKVKFIYRDYPLSFHEFALDASLASQCAGLQGYYYPMYNLLFTNGVTGGKESFKKYARQLPLDQAKFNSCLENAETFEAVRKDYKSGLDLGINSTPSFFINGELLEGAQPFFKFQEVIDSKLAK